MRRFGLAALLALALAACAAPTAPAGIVGRWQRLGSDPAADSFVGDPLQTLAQDVVEFRQEGQLLDLIVSSGGPVTTMSGSYALLDDSHIQINGKCWQGYANHTCSQAYGFRIAGDRLTLLAGPGTSGQLNYQRLGPASAAPAPTLAPPEPSLAPPSATP